MRPRQKQSDPDSVARRVTGAEGSLCYDKVGKSGNVFEFFFFFFFLSLEVTFKLHRIYGLPDESEWQLLLWVYTGNAKPTGSALDIDKICHSCKGVTIMEPVPFFIVFIFYLFFLNKV